MRVPAPGVAAHAVVALALLVPVVVDPWGIDTLTMKRLVPALLGLLVLGLEAAGTLWRGRPRAAPTPAELFLGLLVLWSAASLFWASNPWAGILVVGLPLGVLGLARIVRTSPLPAPLWLAGLLVLGSLAMVADGAGILERAPALEPGSEKYASRLFVHNNIGASWSAMLVPLALALVAGGPSKRRRVVGGFTLLVGLSYLVLLRSRAALLGAMLGIALVGVLLLLRRRLAAASVSTRGLWLILAAPVLAAGLLPFSDPARGFAKDVFYRGINVLGSLGISSLEDSSFRPDVFTKTIQLARAHPLTGVGAGNFAVEYPRFERHTRERSHAHNDGLQILAELGLPGLLLFAAFLCALALRLVQALAASAPGNDYPCAAGLAGAAFVFAVTGLFEIPFAQGASALTLALLLGLVGRLGGLPRPLPSGFARLAARMAFSAAVSLGALLAWRLPATAEARAAAEAETAGDPQAAQALWRRVAGRGTGAYQPLQHLARLALQADRPDEALEHVRAARQLAPHQVELLQEEGGVLLALGRFEEAVAAYREAASAKPGDTDALFQLVYALEQAGLRREAIGVLESQVQARLRAISPDALLRLGHLWSAEAQASRSEEEVRPLVAARHFYAEYLEDGALAGWSEAHRQFKHVTHRLQLRPGSPDSWWAEYEAFLREGGWRLPDTALWTALDGDGVKLFPGWKESAGPPRPRRMRTGF